MTTKYVASQILIVLAYIIMGIGFSKKDRKQILEYSAVYNTIAAIHYILLSGLMGAIASVIALCRNLLFYYNEKKGKHNTKIVLIFFCLVAIALTIIFYQNIFDLFPCILTLVGIYSYWNSKTKVTRIGNIIISLCYIIYAIPLKSYFSIILELYLIIKALIGYFKYETEKSKSDN